MVDFIKYIIVVVYNNNNNNNTKAYLSTYTYIMHDNSVLCRSYTGAVGGLAL